MVARSLRKNRRAMTYVEVLVAALLLGIAAAAAVATWNLSSRIPQSKRLTERAVFIATSEIERLKSIKYTYLANGTTTLWYDKYGVWLGSGASTGAYRVIDTVSVVVPTTPTGTTRDLLQVRVQVQNTAGTVTYEDARTLLTFGGF